VIKTYIFKAKQPKSLLSELNLESGRIYNLVLTWHWRFYRRSGHWLRQGDAERFNDSLGPTLLHAHSRDAAQQAFYKAVKTVYALRKARSKARFPYKRRRFRTTIWKSTGIRVREGQMLLARARGLEPVRVTLRNELGRFPESSFKEVRLVFNHKRKRYDWHVVIDDGKEPPLPPGDNVVAVDLGEIHPAVACSPTQAVVFSARELRATIQYRNKQLAILSALQARCQKRSRMWWRLQGLKNDLKGYTERKIRDICHKVSRAVIDFAIEQQAGTIIIGDVRNIANGKRLHRKSQQKISQWPHGRLRQYITYKAEAAGMRVVLQDERYTSQTCPACSNRHKPAGRVYRCPACGWQGHRDGQVGAPNILSKFLFSELGRVQVPSPKYRFPYLVGKRSRSDTAQVAGASLCLAGTGQVSPVALEAAPL
jgi:putative transposase